MPRQLFTAAHTAVKKGSSIAPKAPAAKPAVAIEFGPPAGPAAGRKPPTPPSKPTPKPTPRQQAAIGRGPKDVGGYFDNDRKC